MVDINKIKDLLRINHMYNKDNSEIEQLYASFALALYDHLDVSASKKADAIEVIFSDTQKIWEENARNDLAKLCADITGVIFEEKGDI